MIFAEGFICGVVVGIFAVMLLVALVALECYQPKGRGIIETNEDLGDAR